MGYPRSYGWALYDSFKSTALQGILVQLWSLIKNNNFIIPVLHPLVEEITIKGALSQI